jgi:hypothetical protein
MAINMGIKFDVPRALGEMRGILASAISDAFDFVVKDFKGLIVDNLVSGGRGWYGLVDTQTWKWINSPKGFAQLGFSSTHEPMKLLMALKSSFYVKKEYRLNKSSDSMYIGLAYGWANLKYLHDETIHSAAGKLNLPSDQSWFDWLYAGAPEEEAGYHFKKTGPRKGVRSSVIAGAEAGLMKTGGLWKVSPGFRLDLDRLFEKNEDRITKVIIDTVQALIEKAL